jgi:hypothetical protein
MTRTLLATARVVLQVAAALQAQSLAGAAKKPSRFAVLIPRVLSLGSVTRLCNPRTNCEMMRRHLACSSTERTP